MAHRDVPGASEPRPDHEGTPDPFAGVRVKAMVLLMQADRGKHLATRKRDDRTSAEKRVDARTWAQLHSGKLKPIAVRRIDHDGVAFTARRRIHNGPMRPPHRIVRTRIVARGPRPRRPVCLGRERMARARGHQRRGPPGDAEGEQSAGDPPAPSTSAKVRAERPSWLANRGSWADLSDADAALLAGYVRRVAEADPKRAAVAGAAS